MKLPVVATVAIFLTIPIAGCMDIISGDSTYTPRTHEFTLYVNQGTQDTIALYELNGPTDTGETHMRVVAMGFTASPDAPLEVPNPEIRVKEGDTVIIHVVNNNPLSHTFHLHGGLVPWGMDGVPFLTQMPIHQGEEFTYVFEDLKAGTYFYHCHVDVAHHIDLGMYGAFIVEEVDPKHTYDREYVLMLDEWDNCHVHGNADPLTGSESTGEFSERGECLGRFLQDNLAQNQIGNAARNPLCEQLSPGQPGYEELDCAAHSATPPQQEPRGWYPVTHPVYNPEYNTYLINGKAFPDTTPLVVKDGERVKVRLINVGEEMHSMHIHGHNMRVTHRDGYPVPAPFRVDTLGIMPGERYDVLIEADNPGFWAFHDHVGLNVMNDHHAPGGMFTCIAYDGFHGRDAFAFERAKACVDEAMAILESEHGEHGGGR